jgi:serine/threonine protein kinase
MPTPATSCSFDEKYEIGSLIGYGGVAAVWECTARATREEYALKVIQNDCNAANEIETLGQLGHRHIIRLHEAFVEGGRKVFLVLELASGGDLFDRLSYEGRFSERVAARYIAQTVAGLVHMHRCGIAHCDIKLENLLLTSTGEDAEIRIVDFAFASQTGWRRSLTGGKGTLQYIAPEILCGVAYGTEVDMWSLGVCLFTMLSGSHPFDTNAESNRDALIRARIKAGRFQFHPVRWDGITEAAKQLVRGLLEPDPTKRLTAEAVLSHEWILAHMPPLLPTVCANSLQPPYGTRIDAPTWGVHGWNKAGVKSC